MEGATENIVEKLYGEQISTNTGRIRFNFSDMSSYQYRVAMIRQLEYALGMEADESILYGKTAFFDSFAKKYGKDAFRVIAHRANRINQAKFKIKKIPSLEDKNEEIEYFKETQDIILRTIFDKELELINTPENAKAYLSKLQGFETTRGKELGKDDIDFVTYYNQQLDLVRDRLTERGYNVEQIDSIIQTHQYSKQKYNPIPSRENEKALVDDQASYFALETIRAALDGEEDKQSKLDEFSFYRGLKGSYDDEYIEHLLITRLGKPISMCILKNFGDMYRLDYTAENGEFDLPQDLSFIQDENGFSIDNHDQSITALQETEITPDILRRVLLRPVNSPAGHSTLRKASSSLESIESLEIIAKTQRLSVINSVVDKIKSAFRNKTAAKDYTMEDEQR